MNALNVLQVFGAELKLVLLFFWTPIFFPAYNFCPPWEVSFTAVEIYVFVDNSLACPVQQFCLTHPSILATSAAAVAACNWITGCRACQKQQPTKSSDLDLVLFRISTKKKKNKKREQKVEENPSCTLFTSACPIICIKYKIKIERIKEVFQNSSHWQLRSVQYHLYLTLIMKT